MLKNRLLRDIILTLTLATVFTFGLSATDPDSTVQQYYNKTVDQLSGLTTAGVRPTKSWFDTHIFAVQKAFADKFQWEDTLTSVRYVVKYDGLSEAIFAGESTPQSGHVVAPPFRTDVIRDTTLWLTSNIMLAMPPGYKIDFRDNDKEDTDALFWAWADTNVTIYGGELYGNADDYYELCSAVADLDETGATDTLSITGVTVTADSLINWYVDDVTNGETRYIDHNLATVGGITKVTFANNWTTSPKNGDVLHLSPMTEFHHGIALWGSKNIRIKDTYLHDFPGDGINIVDGENIVIDGVTIHNPLRDGSTVGDHWLVGRQGISIVVNDSGTAYAYRSPFDSDTLYSTGKVRNIRIVNSDIWGGSPGCIDLEPNADSTYVEDIIIANNYIHRGNRGVAIEHQGAIFQNIVVANNDFSDVLWGMSLNSDSMQNVLIKDNAFRFRQRGLWISNSNEIYIEGNTFEQLNPDSIYTAPYIECLNSEDVYIRHNTFINPPTYAVYISGAKRVFFEDNVIINPGYETGNLARGFLVTNSTQVFVRNNTVYERTGNNEMWKPGELSYCDSVVVYGNKAWGGKQNTITMWLCSSVISDVNSEEFSSTSSTTDGSYGYDLVHPSYNKVGRDTVEVDSGWAYHFVFNSSVGTDTLIWWNENIVADTMILTSPFDTTMTVYNDTLFVAATDSLTADSVSIRKVLYGERFDHGEMRVGHKTGADTVAAEWWDTIYTWRDVVKAPNGILGALWRYISLSTFANSAAQRMSVELYLNEDDRNVAHGGDVTRTFKATGGKFEPDNLILPRDRFSPRLDGSVDTLAVENGMILVRNDTIFIYTAGSWKHWVATGTGYDPTDYE